MTSIATMISTVIFFRARFFSPLVFAIFTFYSFARNSEGDIPVYFLKATLK